MNSTRPTATFEKGTRRSKSQSTTCQLIGWWWEWRPATIEKGTRSRALFGGRGTRTRTFEKGTRSRSHSQSVAGTRRSPAPDRKGNSQSAKNGPKKKKLQRKATNMLLLIKKNKLKKINKQYSKLITYKFIKIFWYMTKKQKGT